MGVLSIQWEDRLMEGHFGLFAEEQNKDEKNNSKPSANRWER